MGASIWRIALVDILSETKRTLAKLGEMPADIVKGIGDARGEHLKG